MPFGELDSGAGAGPHHVANPFRRRFGVGEVFGDRCWDGPAIGPLADASCVADNPGEKLWTALVSP